MTAPDLPRWWPAWLRQLVFRRCAWRGHVPDRGPYLTKRLEIPSSRPVLCAADEVLLDEHRCRCGAARRLVEISREGITDLQLPSRMWARLERHKRIELSRVRV